MVQSESMIEVSNLTKRFGTVTAVDNVSFRLHKGQTLALIGTSGCGKTTTLRMINRLVEPSTGEIYIQGQNVLQQQAEEMRRNIGYVIQDMGLFPHYTIEENIAIVPNLLKWNPDKTRSRVFKLMELLKLPPDMYADKYPHELSGGQQQRVGLARALAGDPPIVLMDEPFGALDPITRREIRKEFRELEEFSEKTTILVTHDVQEAFEMGDQICLLDKGKIQQIGRPSELLFNPCNEFVRSFFADKVLELEFQVITLEDIFDRLPENEPSSSQLPIDADTPVMETLATITRNPASNQLARVTVNGQDKHFDLPGLMQAFQETLNALPHG